MKSKIKLIIILISILGFGTISYFLLNDNVTISGLKKSDYPVMKDDLRCNQIWDEDRLVEENCRNIDNFDELASLGFVSNFIQAPHFDFKFSTVNGLRVQEVDYCRKVTGASMQPVIFTDNYICFINYENKMKSELAEGMIIRIENENKHLIHRIQALYEDYLVIAGDNNIGNERVLYEDIQGVAIVILLR